VAIEANVSPERQIEFRLLRANTLTLAVRESDVLSVLDWTEPTPLPFAPASVLGVVSVEGRMVTVLDVALLLENEVTNRNYELIVALRGGEQLALAVDESNDVIEIKANEIVSDSPSDLISGGLQFGQSAYSILNVEKLFAAVIRGRERRRRRLQS
jgi:chemotaxis signal transduction protein